MPSRPMQKETSFALDGRILKTFMKLADRLNRSVSVLLRLVAAKLRADKIRLCVAS